jgi:serpin B
LVALLAAVIALAIILTTVVATTPGRRSSAVGISSRLGGAYELTALTTPTSSGSYGADEQAVALAEDGFGLSVLRTLVNGGGTSNDLVSPFSLAEALAMAEVGARGQTATQLDHALSISGLQGAVRAKGWAQLQEDLVAGAASDHLAFDDANSIWEQTNFPVRTGFLQSIEHEFGAGVWFANFARQPDAAVRAVNAWVSDATKRHIESLLQPQDVAQAAAILLNAVFFKARWATPFSTTENGTFYGSQGNVTVRYLVNADESLAASVGHGLDAVQLPYWDGSQVGAPGRYAALVLMPTSGSLAEFVDGLTTTSLRSIVQGLTPEGVDLRLPGFNLSSSLQLVSTLESLGVTDAFSSAANFSGFSHIPTMISEVKQDATLDVTKWGTVASAATGVVLTPTAVEVSHAVTIDRPFLFLVRDTTTGVILFASAVNAPAAS